MNALLYPSRKQGLGYRLHKDFSTYKYLYLLFIPVLVYFLVFCYWPMYGVVIAFKNYRPRLGISGSEWVGFEHFQTFFSSPFFVRIMRNTVLLSLYNLVFGFPIPILFAVLLNELRSRRFMRVVQTITYLPHFITTVIICSIILDFTNSEGVLTWIVNGITGHEGSLIADAALFRRIYVISDIWQGFGWNSIVFLAAMTAIDPSLYEAARIDGAQKLQQIRHVTIPGIMPTITIMFILACGRIMSIGWEKAFLLQSPLTYETSDIISTYVYRKGFQEMDYSYSAAVGFFNSVVNLALLFVANTMSRRLGENRLW